MYLHAASNTNDRMSHSSALYTYLYGNSSPTESAMTPWDATRSNHLAKVTSILCVQWLTMMDISTALLRQLVKSRIIFDPSARLLDPFNVLTSHAQVQTGTQRPFHFHFATLGDESSEHVTEEAAQDLHAPVVRHNAQDLTDVEPAGEPREQVARSLNPLGDIVDL